MTAELTDEPLADLIKRLRHECLPQFYPYPGTLRGLIREAADALEAAASRERELEARVRELEADSFEKAHDCAAMERERDEAEARAARMEAALFHHGITVKPDGRFEYEDNSALSEQPCEWSRTVQDAKRYRWLFHHDDGNVLVRTARVWRMWNGEDGIAGYEKAIDAAMAGEE